MLPLRLFRRPFTGAQLAAFAISASFFAVFLYATLYLQQILGLSAIEAGLVYLPGTRSCSWSPAPPPTWWTRCTRACSSRPGWPSSPPGMVLMTVAGPDSSWTAVLPGTSWP